ncbi:NtaA/DmoA family FMN-dependent monooxygenase [Sediminivirga luteola]|uniref:Dibenzothiophene desulfurization enzyme A n=1 Tax=Sediminivirga luteola TaxID=1774748 RepID=A0A8J2XL36_9MICO|nr:NtaA/DmoA family FMN-dependent monooxygenase [Sediminivirga luteola]GGA19353.1 dibenzothiophene desulfurization enzyme A [Sediminivirga luteola]
MTAPKFHLGWFLQESSIQAWGKPWTGNIDKEWADASLFKVLAQELERACFDYILIEDGGSISEAYGQSLDFALKNGLSVPRHEPAALAATLLEITSRIGIVTTLGTYAYHPYPVARIIATHDLLSGGRGGWNVVTGGPTHPNWGLNEVRPHDLRYDEADEYVEAVTRLWDSWEPGAIVADRENGVLVDPEKVHHVNFEGKHYQTRGPLNLPALYGRPVIAQAGGSPRGREFAATHADTVVASLNSAADMKVFRDDIRARAEKNGRNPDDVKVLFLASPILGETNEDAAFRHRRQMEYIETHIEKDLAKFAQSTGIDFSAMDLDAPVEELHTEGHQQNVEQFMKHAAGGKTLREAAVERFQNRWQLGLIGTSAQVAEKMGAMMEEVGGDGFLITLPDMSRRTIAEIVDGLVPELQRRGLARIEYTHERLRDTLLEF